jgi:hypothetical protein
MGSPCGWGKGDKKYTNFSWGYLLENIHSEDREEDAGRF